MAANNAKAKATTKQKEQMVKVKLRKLSDQNAPQEEFFSYNFKNYIIKRGVEVLVPLGLARIIQECELAEEARIAYVEEKALREA